MPDSPVRVNPGYTSGFPATAAGVAALREAISPARLATYLRRTHGNTRRALDLYTWNIQAAATLYPIFQVNEITLRNSVNRALVVQFGPDWPYSQGFLRALPSRERQTFEDGRARLERTLGVIRASTGGIVAAQTWFWTFLLNSRFDKRIWSREFAPSFPHAPPRVSRSVVHERAESIRKLRNRIAHYEPLLDYDLIGAHQRAASMVKWISPATAEWAATRWPLAPHVLMRP
jgi:hypothetical protein